MSFEERVSWLENANLLPRYLGKTEEELDSGVGVSDKSKVYFEDPDRIEVELVLENSKKAQEPVQ